MRATLVTALLLAACASAPPAPSTDGAERYEVLARSIAATDTPCSVHGKMAALGEPVLSRLPWNVVTLQWARRERAATYTMTVAFYVGGEAAEPRLESVALVRVVEQADPSERVATVVFQDRFIAGPVRGWDGSGPSSPPASPGASSPAIAWPRCPGLSGAHGAT